MEMVAVEDVDAGFNFLVRNGAVTETCARYSLFNYQETAPPNDGTEMSRLALINWKEGNPISDFCPVACSDGTPFQPQNLRLNLNSTFEVVGYYYNYDVPGQGAATSMRSAFLLVIIALAITFLASG